MLSGRPRGTTSGPTKKRSTPAWRVRWCELPARRFDRGRHGQLGCWCPPKLLPLAVRVLAHSPREPGVPQPTRRRRREAPVEQERQYVGIDPHRRRSVIVLGRPKDRRCTRHRSVSLHCTVIGVTKAITVRLDESDHEALSRQAEQLRVSPGPAHRHVPQAPSATWRHPHAGHPSSPAAPRSSSMARGAGERREKERLGTPRYSGTVRLKKRPPFANLQRALM